MIGYYYFYVFQIDFVGTTFLVIGHLKIQKKSCLPLIINYFKKRRGSSRFSSFKKETIETRKDSENVKESNNKEKPSNKIKILTRNDGGKTPVKNTETRNSDNGKKAETNLKTHTSLKLKPSETTKPNEKPINNEKEAPATTRPISGDKTTRPPRNRINLIDRKAASKIFQAATRDIKILAKNS